MYAKQLGIVTNGNKRGHNGVVSAVYTLAQTVPPSIYSVMLFLIFNAAILSRTFKIPRLRIIFFYHFH
jgi:hypothetical protein